MKKLETFYQKHRDGIIFAVCSAVYLFWFAYLEETVTDGYHIIRAGLDDYIPFCEYFIVPYLLWFLYVGAGFIWFYGNDREGFRRMTAFLFTGMFLSLMICTAYPNGTDFRPQIDADKNIFAALTAWLYGVDTPTNVLPSIHVYNSIGVHIALTKTERLKETKGLRTCSLILCVLICMATVFLKQHSVIDVFAASVMAYVVYGVVYEPVSIEEMLLRMQRSRALRRDV